MEGKDNIKELFSQKLGNYEAPVNPELWAKISSQVAAGATTTATSTGLSVLAKVGIGLGISAAAITTVVLLSTSSDKEIIPSPSPKEVQKELPTTTTNKQEPITERSTEQTQTNVSVPLVNTPFALNYQQTPEVNIAYVDPNQSTSPTVGEIPATINMPTKGAITVAAGGKSTEPTIVEGVRFGDMTNYGAAPANTEDSEQLEEATTPKVEPIKRYVNVFTPNGDGINDYFALESEGLIDFSVVVFNPAGDVVFQSSDSQFLWDGRDMRSGEMVESGTYMYMVSSQDADGNPYPIYERLVIKR